jgi:hypothetical protein
MDWSFLQPVMEGVISIGVVAGVALIKQYTGVQISQANQDSIRAAAVTEAGKLLTMGVPVTPASAAGAAAKVVNDLPAEVKAEGYNHDDIKDMVLGAASTATPPPAPMVAGKPAQ